MLPQRLTHLAHRCLVGVDGEDAEHFLEGLITSRLPLAGEAQGSALLTPQGKLLFSFLLARTPTGFTLECDTRERDDLVRRLTLYKLRAKVTVGASGLQVLTGDGGDLTDLRQPDMPARKYGISQTSGPVDAYHLERARLGVLEGPDEMIANQDFPHDVALDLTGAVSFTKGCFVGQEVVSRVKHRGTARRRPVLLEGAGIANGDAVVSGDREIGSVRLVVDDRAVAVVRLDQVRDTLSVNGGSVALALPSYATYSLDQALQDDQP